MTAKVLDNNEFNVRMLPIKSLCFAATSGSGLNLYQGIQIAYANLLF
jgi:hypothetical protein